jgi:hypothetical protein
MRAGQLVQRPIGCERDHRGRRDVAARGELLLERRGDARDLGTLVLALAEDVLVEETLLGERAEELQQRRLELFGRVRAAEQAAAPVSGPARPRRRSRDRR